ncbi:MAG: universal stress protein [Firmicutes bacterium]|nr:universal stress protein [Bacillota bacterium]
MFDPKKVLVATDFSNFAEKVLETAESIATKYNASVYLLHVVDQNVSKSSDDYNLPDEVVERYKEQGMKNSFEIIKGQTEKLKSKGIETEPVVMAGNPAEVILSEQAAKGADVIVMGSHGKTGLTRYMLGSVAEKVIRHATVPVLVVRA